MKPFAHLHEGHWSITYVPTGETMPVTVPVDTTPPIPTDPRATAIRRARRIARRQTRRGAL